MKEGGEEKDYGKGSKVSIHLFKTLGVEEKEGEREGEKKKVRKEEMQGEERKTGKGRREMGN